MGARPEVEKPISKKSLIPSKATFGRPSAAADFGSDLSPKEPNQNSQLGPSHSKLVVSPSRQPPTSGPLPKVPRTVHQYPSISLFLNANESKVFRVSKQLPRELEEDTKASPQPGCKDVTHRPTRYCNTAIAALSEPSKTIESFSLSKRMSQIPEDGSQEPNIEAGLRASRHLTDGEDTKARRHMPVELHHYPSVSKLLHATESQIFTKSTKTPRETPAAIGREELGIDGVDKCLATRKTYVAQRQGTLKAGVMKNENICTPPAQAWDALTRHQIVEKSSGYAIDTVIARPHKPTKRSRPLSSNSFMVDDASEDQVFKRMSLIPLDSPSRTVGDYEDWLQLASSTAEDRESDVELEELVTPTPRPRIGRRL
ncbi:hypothetical protein LTR64_008082 [Lithohypha guttulata]|uniref:uncharacterized protein n=1 Tax=Lithohypha guttulata TaxID=1690604 RepID=UPI002DE0E041|nr:hypothetical protein LTR51_008048 [Lithohypha guttulata]